MRKLIVFNNVSLDGYIADRNGDMSWAHQPGDDAEWNAFVADNARGGGGLIFGRTTYQMMAHFWPTPQAVQALPELAARMNQLPKVVFSRTLGQASWSNTRLLRGDLADEIAKLKAAPGEDLAILGSGSIVGQAAEAGLVDEFQLVMNPIVLGQGTSMFGTIGEDLPMRLTKTRVFGNGNVLLCYQPAGTR
jgi:dihydrofolate reductase